MPWPICPSCRNEIEWKQSFTFWNPWSYPCPHCKTLLEASRVQKYIAIAVVPVGLVLATAAILLGKLEVWGTNHTVVYFLVAVSLLVVGARASWSLTRFNTKAAK